MSYLKKSEKMIKPHEGCRLVVYDDATGYLVKPGYTLKGHPTIGWGRALDESNGLSGSEADYLFRNDQQRVMDELTGQQFSFWDGLSEWRKAVLMDMAFNMGIGKFLEFEKMLAALEIGDIDETARQMENSRWFRQTGVRGKQDCCIMKFNRWYSKRDAKCYFKERKKKRKARSEE